MDIDTALTHVIDSILELEASLAKYAILTNNQELVDRWSSARNEYLSLLTWLENNR